MSELTDQLRKFQADEPGFPKIFTRAADEIERLLPYVEAFRREETRADKFGTEVDDLRDEIERLSKQLVKYQAFDREKVAEILYTAAHKGLKNCWKWSDAGLDAEHPTSRGRYRKMADGIVALLKQTDDLHGAER